MSSDFFHDCLKTKNSHAHVYVCKEGNSYLIEEGNTCITQTAEASYKLPLNFGIVLSPISSNIRNAYLHGQYGQEEHRDK